MKWGTSDSSPPSSKEVGGRAVLSKADVIYNELVRDVIENGVWDTDQKVRTKWSDGTPAHTKSVFGKQLIFDGTEVPILTTKKVYWVTAVKEILWIWQQKDNNVENLRKQGVTIWDKWELPDKTIGKAYGYQMGKKVRKLNGQLVDQVDFLLHELKHNPASRRHITSLWNIDDLDEMSLQPCVWHTQWLVKESKLHLIVGQRSCDVAVGLPFNLFQYYVLQRLISQVTGYEPGQMIFNIGDVHIYDRHIDKLKEQIELPQYPAPQLWINPEIKDFYQFTIDDIKLINYQHGPVIRMEVAQ